jgi:cobaltochelatase CobT
VPPEAAREGLKLVSGWIEEKAGADLDALGLAIDDQAAFAQLATKVLQDLELVEAEMDAESDPDGDLDADGDQQDQSDDGDDQNEDEAGGGEGETEMRVEQGDASDEDSQTDYSEQEMEDGQEGAGEEGEEGALPVRPNRPMSTCRRSSIIASSPPNMTRSSRRWSCATTPSSTGFAPISTSSLPTCKAPLPSLPTGCSAG